MRLFYFAFFITLYIYAEKEPESKLAPGSHGQIGDDATRSSKPSGESDSGALVESNYKNLPDKIPGLTIAKIYEVNATFVTLKEGKKLPLWTPVDVKGEEQEFRVLYNHFTGEWWGPGGGDEAFSEKFWKGMYTPEEAVQRCAELDPKGQWRLPDVYEANNLFDHKVEQQWASLSNANGEEKLQMVIKGNYHEPDSLFYFIPNSVDESGKKVSIAGHVEENKNKNQKYKFKCVLGESKR